MLDTFLRSFGALVLVLAAVPVSGAVVPHADLTAWSTAASGTINTIDFGNIDDTGTSLTFGTSPNQVTFTPFVAGSLSASSAGGIYAACDGHCLFATGSTNPGLIATPSSPLVTAIAVYLFTQDVQTHDIGITVHTTGGTQSFTVVGASGNAGPATFFGVTSDDAITSIEITTLTGANGMLAIDNFKFNAAAAPDPPTDTPESASLGYVGLGLLALLLGRKRHTKKVC
ncbi:MAG: hypothetical protein HY820_24280 [Acidobacteria bacterium]|nr:hypothetical protein [Acidobacteriota bacterium]